MLRSSKAGGMAGLQMPDEFSTEDLFEVFMQKYGSGNEGGSCGADLEKMSRPAKQGAEDESTPSFSASEVGACASTQLGRSSTKRAAEDECGGGQEHRSKRQKRKDQSDAKWKKYGHLPTRSTRDKYVLRSYPSTSPVSLQKLPSKAGGYTAKSNNTPDRSKAYTLEEILDIGFILVKASSCDRPIVDRTGKVVMVVVPPPYDPMYYQAADRAWHIMLDEGEKVKFRPEELNHCRGSGFAAINVGLSYGHGSTKPSRPNHGRMQGLVETLLGNEDIQRLAAYQDATFALWHPEGYRYYKEHLDKLWGHHPELDRPNFPRSILPKVAFNIGKNVWTHKHVDSQNCPFGWCAVTALGQFDHMKGGHLILWELGLVVELPPGYCACIPSAIITHSNLPVGKGEVRLSFTQYCPGEVFRYVENGFSTDTALKKSNPALFAERKASREKRLQRGFQMFSTIKNVASLPARTARAQNS